MSDSQIDNYVIVTVELKPVSQVCELFLCVYGLPLDATDFKSTVPAREPSRAHTRTDLARVTNLPARSACFSSACVDSPNEFQLRGSCGSREKSSLPTHARTCPAGQTCEPSLSSKPARGCARFPGSRAKLASH